MENDGVWIYVGMFKIVNILLNTKKGKVVGGG